MRIPELDRLNALARKAKNDGLSAAECAERDALRQAYVRQVSGQMHNMLAVMSIVDAHGQDVTPTKLRAAQARGMLQTI